MRGVIYKYTSPSGKSYIGQTTSEEFRRKCWNYSQYHYAGSKIDRARAKYGRNNFTYEVLFDKEFNTKEIASIWLNIAEKYFIQLYDTVNSGYNCESGGKGNPHHTGAIHHHCGGYKLSESTKARIGKASKTWQNTPEGKAKMSAARKGITKQKGYRIEKNFKAIIQLSLDGEYIQEFPSIRDAGEYLYHDTDLLKNKNNISAVCRGKRDSAGGYKWLYKEDYYRFFLHPEKEGIPQRVQRALGVMEKRHTTNKNNSNRHIKKDGPRINSFAQKVGQYNEYLQLVKIWRCATEAAKQLGINQGNISRAVKTQGMYMGFYWRKYEGQQICEPKQKKMTTREYATKKVLQKDLQDNIVCTYNSIGEACECIGTSNRTLLSRCLNGKISKAYGYKWEILNCT